MIEIKLYFALGIIIVVVISIIFFFFKSPKIRFIDRHHSNYYGRRAKAFRVKRRTDGFWETIRDGVPIIAGSPREIFDTLKSYEGVN